MASCPIITGTDPAVAIVTQMEQRIVGYASDAWARAGEAFDGLSAFSPAAYQFQVSFNFDDSLTGFQRPARPEDPEFDFDPQLHLPALANISWPTVQIGTSPTFNQVAPILSLPSAPSLVIPAIPDQPSLTPIVIPDVPKYTLPDVPVLREIVIPADPLITIPEFSAIAPIRNFEVPPFDFHFEVEPYTDALLDRVKERLTTMLEGGTGLPVWVEQALFDRTASREDANDQKAITEAIEEYSARGFSEPSGLLTRRMAEVRQNARNARSAMNRDVFIRQEDVILENLRFSVTQGVALESILIDAHFKTAGLLLEAAKFSQEATLRILDARIAVLNADTTLFVARAGVFRDLLQGELAKLEIFKAKIDAQRLIGEINKDEIAIYEAQLRAVDTLFGIYKAQIDGQNAISANNNSKIQGFAALVQARESTVRALGYEFDAYKTQVEAEKVKGDIYETSARAFGSLVNAYQAENQLKIEQGRFGIQKGQAQLDEWRQKSQNVIEQVRLEALKVTTQLDIFRGFLDRYRTDASVEQTAEEANARKFQLMLEKEKSNVDTQLKNVQLLIDQMDKLSALILESMKTQATVGAQLAGSALSALNVRASIDSGHSVSQTYSLAGQCGDS